MPEYSDDFLSDILRAARTIAIVGVSANEIRPSYYVARYLNLKGHKVIGVNPGLAGREMFGNRVAEDLSDIPADVGDIHMVDIFRQSSAVPGIVDQALEHLLDRGLQTIWMQFNVIHKEAAEKARAAGLNVVMDRCPKLETQRLFGELRMGGFNTGIISSKLRS